MSGTPPPYAVDDLVKDSVSFIINSTSGELIVSEALVEEHYDLLILARGVEYTTRIEVLVTFSQCLSTGLWLHLMLAQQGLETLS